MLFDLAKDLDAFGISLVLAEVKGPVKDTLRRHGLIDHIGEHHIYPTVGAAVHAYLDTFGVPWTDWEDEQPGSTRPR
jgi:hypothetical protein